MAGYGSLVEGFVEYGDVEKPVGYVERGEVAAIWDDLGGVAG